jgi:hypothetical protein
MNNWNEKTVLEKISDIISAIALCAWLIFESMDSNGVVGWADIASRIAIIVICVFEGISFWNKYRILSYVAIGGIICLIATFVLEFMIPAK